MSLSQSARIPSFAQLPVRSSAPPGASWGVFGDDDQVGTLNFIGAEQVRIAADLVDSGKVLPLGLSIDAPSPTFFHRSASVRRPIVLNEGESIDDYLDNFYPHASSHWDALRHYADVDYGFYNGASLEAITDEGGLLLGVHHWARRGIVARGVLLDVPRFVEAEAYDPLGYYPVTDKLAVELARREGVEIRQGDIVLVRTGWLAAFLSLSERERNELVESSSLPAPGLGGVGMPRMLWDLHVAASASDTPVFEAQRGEGMLQLELHKALIARLGMPIGELWQLDALAEECARDGRYDFLLTSAPLNIPGGAGSPANALAIK